jgi:hypothetical protein
MCVASVADVRMVCERIVMECDADFFESIRESNRREREFYKQKTLQRSSRCQP